MSVGFMVDLRDESKSIHKSQYEMPQNKIWLSGRV